MNKKELIDKCAKYGCEVEIDLYDGRNKTVRIIAPQGKNFSGQHEVIVTWYDGKASDLYQEAYDQLVQEIPALYECDETICGSWVKDGDREYCEYWDV
jgi:hypothetical protein